MRASVGLVFPSSCYQETHRPGPGRKRRGRCSSLTLLNIKYRRYFRSGGIYARATPPRGVRAFHPRNGLLHIIVLWSAPPPRRRQYRCLCSLCFSTRRCLYPGHRRPRHAYIGQRFFHPDFSINCSVESEPVGRAYLWHAPHMRADVRNDRRRRAIDLYASPAARRGLYRTPRTRAHPTNTLLTCFMHRSAHVRIVHSVHAGIYCSSAAVCRSRENTGSGEL